MRSVALRRLRARVRPTARHVHLPASSSRARCAEAEEARARCGEAAEEDRLRNERARAAAALREEQRSRVLAALASGPRLVVDLAPAYTALMSARHRRSLSQQLGRCWALNRRAPAPFAMHLASLRTCPAECLPAGGEHERWLVGRLDGEVSDHFGREGKLLLEARARGRVNSSFRAAAVDRRAATRVVAEVAGASSPRRCVQASPLAGGKEIRRRREKEDRRCEQASSISPRTRRRCWRCRGIRRAPESDRSTPTTQHTGAAHSTTDHPRSDSPQAPLEAEKTYVIGGLVDGTVVKHASIDGHTHTHTHTDERESDQRLGQHKTPRRPGCHTSAAWRSLAGEAAVL